MSFMLKQTYRSISILDNYYAFTKPKHLLQPRAFVRSIVNVYEILKEFRLLISFISVLDSSQHMHMGTFPEGQHYLSAAGENRDIGPL